jgi:hypothetical protein
MLFNEKYDDFSTLYWIPKLHKNPYSERYRAGVSTGSTNKEIVIKYG